MKWSNTSHPSHPSHYASHSSLFLRWIPTPNHTHDNSPNIIYSALYEVRLAYSKDKQGSLPLWAEQVAVATVQCEGEVALTGSPLVLLHNGVPSSATMSRGFALSFSLLSLLSTILFVRAGPVSLPFEDCFSETRNAANKFNITTVYAQVLKDEVHGTFANLTVFGTSPSTIVGLTNESTSLGTCMRSTI